MELIRQLWMGNISLARTFWLYFVCISVLIKIVEKALTANYFPLLIGGYQLIFYLFIGVQVICYGFILIALWRSASKYTGQIFFAGLAKFVVIIGFMNLTLSIMSIGGTTSINLAEEARIINQSLPAKLDSMTQLDNVVADGKKLVYHYKITSSVKNLDLDKLQQGIKRKFQTEMCLRDDIKRYLSQNVTFVYVYETIDNSYLPSIELSQSDCVNL